MTKMMTLPVANVPAAISENLAAALKKRGMAMSADFLDEVSNDATQALLELDESLATDAEPSMADRLAVGETLRALAMMGRPNAQVARALDRVGAWLTKHAKAEAKKHAEDVAA